MLQDPFLFSGSIRDNIRYGRLDATDERGGRPPRKAVNLHDFIESLPFGYDTEVQERGSTLSQGQRQLLSFARALIADPRILVLDEATSSVDTATEKLIQQALDVLMRGAPASSSPTACPPSRRRPRSSSCTTGRSSSGAPTPSC